MSKFHEVMGEIDVLLDRASAEHRELTGAEKAQYDSLISWAKQAGEVENKMREVYGDSIVKEIGRELGGGMSSAGAYHGGGSPGEMFVRSEGYKKIQSASTRGQNWSTGPVAIGLPGYEMKGTLLEGVGSPGSGSGGGLLPVPQVVPGIVPKLFQPLTLEALLSSGQASGNQVRSIVEGTATSGAAGVAEAGLKPESTFGFGVVDEPVKKIATSVVVSDEMLEDVASVQAFINNQMSLFVRIEAERQLLRGTQGGNEVQGILTSRSVPIYAGGTAAGNKAVQVFKALNGTRGSSFIEPEWCILHPDDWQTIRLLTDTQGQFFGGGPFMGQYGAGVNLQASGQVTGAQDTLWNKPVYLSTIIGAGTALIGNSQAAQVWNKGGVSIEATNSHDTHFVHDLIAVRSERRLGLCVYQPQAFCEIRLA